VAHNINEKMRPNQFGGCAMMAMSTIAPEVIDTGVDTTGLGRWCWMRIGLGWEENQNSHGIPTKQFRPFCRNNGKGPALTLFPISRGCSSPMNNFL
jgi:hypothetical protein